MLDQERFDIYIDSLSADHPKGDAKPAGFFIGKRSAKAYFRNWDSSRIFCIVYESSFTKGCQNHYDRKSRTASGRGEEKSGSL